MRTEKAGLNQSGGTKAGEKQSRIYLKAHPHPLPRSDVIVRGRERRVEGLGCQSEQMEENVTMEAILSFI